MSIDGTWETVTNTPMGKQNGTLVLKSDGSALTGEMKSAMGTMAVEDGKVEGNTATFMVKMTKPMPMKLEFNVKADGDKLSGECKMGVMGKAAIEGTRA